MNNAPARPTLLAPRVSTACSRLALTLREPQGHPEPRSKDERGRVNQGQVEAKGGLHPLTRNNPG